METQTEKQELVSVHIDQSYCMFGSSKHTHLIDAASANR